MSGGICPRCGQRVFQAEEVRAFGKVWHSFCFSCNMCRKLLEAEQAVVQEDEIYCQTCTYRMHGESQRRYTESRKEFDTMQDACTCNLGALHDRQVSFQDNSRPTCYHETCKVSYAERESAGYAKKTASIRSVHSEPPRAPIRSLRALPSPTGITTYYNRQHLSIHSDIGSRRTHDGIISAHDGDLQRCEKCRENELAQCPYEEILAKTKEGNFTVSLKPVECSSSRRSIHSDEVSRSHQQSTVHLQPVPNICYNDANCPREGEGQRIPLGSLSRQRVCGDNGTEVNTKELSTSSCKKEDWAESSRGDRTGDRGGPHDENHDSALPEHERKQEKRQFGYGGTICKRCGRKVYHAEMVLATNSAFHNICFSCYACRKPLDTMTVYENQGEIYCKQCYIKLFGPTGYGYGIGAGALQTPF